MIQAIDILPLDVAKAHAKIQHSLEDDLLIAYIQGAVSMAEKMCNRDFVRKTVSKSVQVHSYECANEVRIRGEQISDLEITRVSGSQSHLLNTESYFAVAHEGYMTVAFPYYTTSRMGGYRYDFVYQSGLLSMDGHEDLRVAVANIVAQWYAVRESTVGTSDNLLPMPLSATAILHQYVRYL